MALRDTIADIAALLALVTGARLVLMLASLLLALVPRRLRDEEPELSAEVAERVAKDVAALDVPDAYDADGIRRDAARENLQRRAEYAVNAMGRLSTAVSGAERGKRRQALARAYRAERRHFEAHREASERRAKASETTAAMVRQRGPRLKWVHSATRVPAEPRPSHKRADGKVFNLSEGLPRGPDVLPGMLPGCSCQWAAPSGGEPEMY